MLGPGERVEAVRAVVANGRVEDRTYQTTLALLGPSVFNRAAEGAMTGEGAIPRSTNGHLNFNVDLLGLDQDLWDYVIVHELLHFFVPNHGKLWKSLMRAHLGSYEVMEAELARYG